jgi:hypothetical protein
MSKERIPRKNILLNKTSIEQRTVHYNFCGYCFENEEGTYN